MFTWAIWREALLALAARKQRAALTVLGIAWGIVAVVLLMAYGNGLHNALFQGFSGGLSYGTIVITGSQTSKQAGGERAGRPIKLIEDDLNLLSRVSAIVRTSPEYTLGRVAIVAGPEQTAVRVRAVAPEYGLMRSEIAGVGRFINDEDIDKHRRVVFLGSELARRLFGNKNAIGETVRIKGQPFEVIGVMAEKVQLFSYEAHDRYCAFIPHNVAQLVWRPVALSYLVFQIDRAEEHDEVLRQIRILLATRHGFDADDDRAIRVVSDSIENNRTFGGITTLLKVILTFIGAITLMIGGIGVMNIMFVSVMERTSEIGLRKAVGATSRQILSQFLFEALAITFLGGLVGIVLAYTVIALIGRQPFLADLLADSSHRTDINLVFSLDIMLVTTVILIIVGLISGLSPAIRAAKLDPVKALQYE